MVDYEQLFAMELQKRLKNQIVGRIYVEVNRHDQLFVKIVRDDDMDKFELHLDNFSERMLNGWSTAYASYEVIQKYREFIMDIMEKKYFYQKQREHSKKTWGSLFTNYCVRDNNMCLYDNKTIKGGLL